MPARFSHAPSFINHAHEGVMLEHDLRAAWRGIRRTPGFAALVIATMALGIGANTTMFGVIRAVFLRPLPYPEPDRLVSGWENDPRLGMPQRLVSPANFVDWEAQSDVFAGMGVTPEWTGQSPTFNVAGRDGVQRVEGIYASSGFFRALGVRPFLGRSLDRDDD